MMTVKELIAAGIFCDLAEIVVRKDGRWIQGYRIGKNAKIYPSEVTAEMIEQRKLEKYYNKQINLKEGEEVEFEKWASRPLPMKVFCRDVKKLPENIANLEVERYQPRHIPSFHKDKMTHNEFALDITCRVPEKGILTEEIREEKKKKSDYPDNLPGQMRIEDFL